MTTTIDLNEERLQAFLDRAFADLAASYGGVMVSLGDRLGLYWPSRGRAPHTSAELAERAAVPSATSASGSAARSRQPTSTTTLKPRPSSCRPSTRRCSRTRTARC